MEFYSFRDDHPPDASVNVLNRSKQYKMSRRLCSRVDRGVRRARDDNGCRRRSETSAEGAALRRGVERAYIN